MIGMKNKRLKYLLLTLFVVILGLLSRKMSACTLDFVKLYLRCHPEKLAGAQYAD